MCILYKIFGKTHWGSTVLKPLLSLVLLSIATGCRPAQPPVAQPSSEPVKPALSPSAAPITTAPDAAPSAPASSVPATSPSQPLNCDNPQGSEAANRCAQRDYESADALLNQTYRQLKDGLSQKDQQQLVEAETAWLSFRDRSCEFERSLTTGETQPRALYQCLQRTTADRTAELKAQAKIP